MKRSLRLKLHLALLAPVVVFSGSPAFAQDAYRCGSSYSQSPCPGGTPMTINDKRTEEQRASAQEVARRDAALADAMEKRRRQDEQQAIASAATTHATKARTNNHQAAASKDKALADRQKHEKKRPKKIIAPDADPAIFVARSSAASH
jgi:hypothetical protein